MNITDCEMLALKKYFNSSANIAKQAYDDFLNSGTQIMKLRYEKAVERVLTTLVICNILNIDTNNFVDKGGLTMADYIDREKLLKLLQAGYECEEAPCWTTCPWIEDEIKRAPSVDAVEVVRCIRCKYSKYICINGLCDGLFCYKIGRPIDDDFFCKWGEKE